MHTLHYRRAHSDDLGVENDGTYHQVRALQPSANMTDTGIVQRAEVNHDGVVMDYLWKNGVESWWDDTLFAVSESSLDQAAASTVTTFAEAHGSEVSCADIIVANEGNSGQQGVEGPEDIGSRGLQVE